MIVYNKNNPLLKVSVRYVSGKTFSGVILADCGVWKKDDPCKNFAVDNFFVAMADLTKVADELKSVIKKINFT